MYGVSLESTAMSRLIRRCGRWPRRCASSSSRPSPASLPGVPGSGAGITRQPGDITMSAYVCAPEHFAALAAFASAGRDSHVIREYKDADPIVTARRVAVELARENIRSVNHRYPGAAVDGGLPGPGIPMDRLLSAIPLRRLLRQGARAALFTIEGSTMKTQNTLCDCVILLRTGEILNSSHGNRPCSDISRIELCQIHRAAPDLLAALNYHRMNYGTDAYSESTFNRMADNACAKACG